MKDIHKLLIEKRSNILTCYIPPLFRWDYKSIFSKVSRMLGYTNHGSHYPVWSPLDERNMYTGNYWLKYDDFSKVLPEPKLVTVYNKCGIELLFPYSMNFSPFGYGYIKLCEHLKNNLYIDCPKNLDYTDNEYDKYEQYNHYKDLMKICRSI